MRLYLAPKSSLGVIHHLRTANGDDGLGGTSVRRKRLDDAINGKRAMSELDETAQRWLAHAGDPVYSYVGDRARGTSTKHLVTQVMSEPVPSGAFLNVGHNVCICTPQYAFMQMAKDLDLVDAIGLGMEFCGAYSIDRLDTERTLDASTRKPSLGARGHACSFELPRIASAARMANFAERLWGHRGRRKAQEALRWVIDNSASPMETAVYLLLCLPKRLGGYGLPKPVLNPKLIISNPDGKKERYPDLFWLGPNIDIEYNSDKEHSGEWARYRDSKREVELVVADVKVMPLTRLQLTNVDEFDTFAQGLRRMLGVRTRPIDAEWKHRRADLRRRLLPSS